MSSRSAPTTPTISNESNKLKPCRRSVFSIDGRRPTRTVSFPADDKALVTGYLDPVNPWKALNVNVDLVVAYQLSCERHGVQPIGGLSEQLKQTDMNHKRGGSLKLRGEKLDSKHVESLEDVLKRHQFNVLDVEETDLSDEAAMALFDMLEFYESCLHLKVGRNKAISARGWHAFSRMLKMSPFLDTVDLNGSSIGDNMCLLSRALRMVQHLTALHLENTNLSSRPIIQLAADLKLNTSVKELYLADNNLGATDAVQIANMLRVNPYIQLLDLRNNNLQDTGAGYICDSVSNQEAGKGVSILVLWNNNLTHNVSTHIAKLLMSPSGLETLNIGYNNLTNEGMKKLQESVSSNRTLLRLGLQSIQLNCEGAAVIADIVSKNTSLQRIDLRENNIRIAGMSSIATALKQNGSIIRIDIDRRQEDNMTEFQANIDTILNKNRKKKEERDKKELENKQRDEAVRKISLTCEMSALQREQLAGDRARMELKEVGKKKKLVSPTPSPVGSPSSSPCQTSKSRFKVSRVGDIPVSRFLVSLVEPECTMEGRNIEHNVRRNRFQVKKVEPYSAPAVVSRFKVSRVDEHVLANKCNVIVVKPDSGASTVGFTVEADVNVPGENVKHELSDPDTSVTSASSCEDALRTLSIDSCCEADEVIDEDNYSDLTAVTPRSSAYSETGQYLHDEIFSQPDTDSSMEYMDQLEEYKSKVDEIPTPLQV